MTYIVICTTFHRYPIFSTRYSVMCKVYTGYCGTSEIEHGLCACTVDNPLAKARGLSLRTGAQPMLYLPRREWNCLTLTCKNVKYMHHCSIQCQIYNVRHRAYPKYSGSNVWANSGDPYQQPYLKEKKWSFYKSFRVIPTLSEVT